MTRRPHVAKSLRWKSPGDARADSGLFIKLYEIARARFFRSQLGEDEMWPTAKTAFHTGLDVV